MFWPRLILTLLAGCILAAPAAADPGGRHHRDDDRRDDDRPYQQHQDMGAVIITALERSLIREYYRDNPATYGDSLPPGIRKKLARGKPLPPGIAKKMPGGLHARLPPRPGYDYRVVGADVALIEIATGVIVDILHDAMR